MHIKLVCVLNMPVLLYHIVIMYGIFCKHEMLLLFGTCMFFCILLCFLSVTEY